MPATDVTADVSGHAVDDEASAVCAVCPHSWTDHDRIAARYCTATVAGQFSRGCVCTAYPDDAGHTSPDKDTR